MCPVKCQLASHGCFPNTRFSLYEHLTNGECSRGGNEDILHTQYCTATSATTIELT